MATQTQTPTAPSVKVEDFIQVTIDGKPYSGIVLQIDETNGNVQVAVQGFPRPIWATPKVEAPK